MSAEDYKAARQLGQKEYRARLSRGEYPYLQVLDETLRHVETRGEEDLGLVNIPMEKIVGTRSEGRRDAFSCGFMPLLDVDSEFAAKWIALSEAHLKEGIRDPVTAWEFMNRFYIAEGNKRVSVLKYFGAVTVPGVVRRVIPKPRDTEESRVYYDFLDFYKRTGVNYVWMSRPGRFKKLLLAVRGDEETWSGEERREFSAAYAAFRRAFLDLGGGKLPGTTGDALLAYLDIYGYAALREESVTALKDRLSKSWNELAAYSGPAPVELELDPEKGEKTLLGKLLTPRPETVKALFLYERGVAASGWAHAHEEGRRAAEEALNGRAATFFEDNVSPDKAEEAIARGVKEGAEVVFTTSPKLLPACLKAAAEHPEVKMLNCSVYTPHPSIRTYYGRMYEVKLLAGMIAGAMTKTHRIGYIADYPIYGAAAAVNAFALGAKMTDPWAEVCLEWRAQGEQGIWEKLIERDVDMISGLDLRSPVDPWRAYGLYRVERGVGTQVGFASWNWGRFYTRILGRVLEGEWKKAPDTKAINYWWGLSAGVVDLEFTPRVPDGVTRLVRLVERDMVAGRFVPFLGPLSAQGGKVIQTEGSLSPEDILRMDWLCENVIGAIPAPETLTPEARELVALQGIGREGTA